MVDFTVAIPTYNGEHRLPEVLERLKCQVEVDSITWEVIVVDNNSTDGTADVVALYQQHWLAGISLRYCFEPQQGAAFARERAVREASGTWVGCLDDDNLPAPNWIAAAIAFGQAHPQAGAFGSQIAGAFEENPPAGFQAIACYLAITNLGSVCRLYEPHRRMLPAGAGLVVRRQAWLDAVPPVLVLNNAGKESGLASEDLEAVLHIQNAGWEVWHNPAMQIVHKIPKWRLERDYLLSLVRCVGLSRHRLRMLRVRSWQRPLAFMMHFANDLRRLLLHWLKYPTQCKQDLVIACQAELLINSLISPFFIWRLQYLRVQNAAVMKRCIRQNASSLV